jgi:hypothetical protein
VLPDPSGIAKHALSVIAPIALARWVPSGTRLVLGPRPPSTPKPTEARVAVEIVRSEVPEGSRPAGDSNGA